MTPVDFDVLAYEPSPLGMLCLRQRELLAEPGTRVTEVTLDHQFLMSSCNTVSERALASRGLALLGERRDLDVLVGGLGLGYTACEVLESPRVARTRVVEYLAPVIDWLERGLLPLSERLRADPRFEVIRDDVYARLALPPEARHDLVLIDVDHSPDERLGEQSLSFYTDEGLALAKRHLAPGGVLGVWAYAESPTFAETLERVFGNVHVECVTFENRAFHEPESNWLFFAQARG